MESNERYISTIQNYGIENFKLIQSSRILVIGAGGIGCEIIKNLSFMGFVNIEIIDLDTIDVSNLNRQFLFRQEHVGSSKAIVTKNAALQFNPSMNIIAHHDNIKCPQFDVNYFMKFNVVLNALDNIDARRHVNRLCLAANTPLIDSGTTGYLGQVMPIQKGVTACYECFPKPTQKVYPICTIRSTPDKPVHCIVWAKELFKLLFSNPSDSMLYEDKASGETSTYMHLISIPISQSIESTLISVVDLIDALYNTEIVKRIEMQTYQKAKSAPVPLSKASIEEAIKAYQDHSNFTIPSKRQGWDQQVFSVVDNIVELFDCLVEITQGLVPASMIHSLSFDKDDVWAMRFVTAASNLRSFVFGIPILSYYDAKGIAGNIIPAIATTNAIVAAVQVLQAINIITTPKLQINSSLGQPTPSMRDTCPHAYVLRMPTRRGHFLDPTKPDLPSPDCYVCGLSQLTLLIDVNESTLSELLSKVIKGRLCFNEPSIMMESSFVYEEGEGADEDLLDNLPLKLIHCPNGGIKEGSLLQIEDFTQKLQVQIHIRHIEMARLESHEQTSIDLFVLGTREGVDRTLHQLESSTNSNGSAAEAEIGATHSITLDDEGTSASNWISSTINTTTPLDSLTSNISGVKRKHELNTSMDVLE